MALAVRAAAPIFADVDLLDRTSVEVQDGTLEPGFAGSDADFLTPAQEDAPPEKLRDYLKRLDPEDFGRFIP